MMSPILLIAGRFLLASALLMALYWIVWRKQSTHRAKRMYLLSMPIVAIAIALLQVEVYQPDPVVVEVESRPSQGRGVNSHEPTIETPIETLVSASVPALAESDGQTLTLQQEADGISITFPSPNEGKRWILTAYVVITLALCIPFVVNLVQLRRLRRKVSVINHEANDISILMGQAVEAPFSFHRSIFMPLSLTETQRRMILAHERAHILHRHYLDVWVAEGVTRLFWWNPFLWWARAELRNVHEFEADADVLTSGEDVYTYQSILIEEVLHGDVVIANGFNHSFIRRRFIEMTQSSNRRMTSLAKTGSMAWMLLIVALMCCTVGEAEVIYKETKLTTAEDNGKWHEAESKTLSEYLPDMVSNLSNESVATLIQALSTMNSIKELSPEEYEELKNAYPAGTIPSMESINKSVREIKKSLETQMSENMNNAIFDLNKSLHEQLREKGLDTLSSSKKEEKDKVYHFTEKGNPFFIDANGNIHEYTIKGNEISEEGIEILINSTSQFTLDSMEVQGVIISALGGFFNSMFGSLIDTFTPLEKEAYDSILSLFSLGEEAPSLEEINQQLELLRDSIQMMTNAFSLKPGEVFEVPMSYEEPIIIDEYATYEAPVRDLEIERKNAEKFRSVGKILTNWTHRASIPGYKFSTGEYEIAKKIRPDLPSESEAHKSEEYVKIINDLCLEHTLEELNDKDIANQVNSELSRVGLNNFKGREIAFIIDFGQQFALYWKGTNTTAFRWTLIPIASDVNEKLKDDDPLFNFMQSWFQLSERVKLLSEEEFEEAKKSTPTSLSYSDCVENWLKDIYLYHNQMKKSLSLMDKKMRSKVEDIIKSQGWVIPRGRTMKIMFEYDGNRWEIEKGPNGGLTMNGSITSSNSEKTYSEEELENFISPQWGLVLPKGSIRLTEYKEKAKIDATARKQYDQLMNCIRNAQALRKDALTNAFGKKHSRYVTVEESVKEKIRKLFQDANIEMLELGAYRLQDGTIVMEDDRLNLMPQSVNYHHGTTDRSTLLRNQAPTMERDKSPNYDAHNEQTWPVYTNVQKVSKDEYKAEPQVFRGEDCTYVVTYSRIYYDFHWFHPTSRDVLVDRKTDDQYMIRYREHFPLDTYMWIHGQEGEYIRMVDVFPPLPKDVTTVDLIPGEIPFGIKLSNASPYQQYENLKVQTLNKNENIVY